MKDKKWMIIVICVLVVLVLAFALLGGKKYTVTFDTDGGSSVNSVTVKKNDSVAKPVNPNKEGYTFVRWDLNGSEYDFSSKVTSDITLKAIWEQKEVVETIYNVTLNNEGNTETIKVANGKITGLPSPSKEGYNFIGWFDGNNKVSVGDVINSDITLTAKFEKIPAQEVPKTDSKTEPVSDTTVKYTVTFNSDGGSSVKKQTVAEGKKVSKPSNPTKSGYTFVAWTLDGKEYDFSKAVTKNITLKATWAKKEEVKTYTVTFDSDGGSSVKIQTVVEGKKASKPSNPTKKSYNFLGWYLNGNLYSFDTEITSNITLKAKWEYVPKLSYELILDPGTIVNQAKLYILADGKRVAGICDITMNTGKVVTKEIPASGLAINKDKVDKVTNIRLK